MLWSFLCGSPDLRPGMSVIPRIQIKATAKEAPQHTQPAPALAQLASQR